ncbi:unnamed protein product [Peronospora destructor]|uniref:GB1/RHD3-type G domain-containing protein n=1 Tax=Peronospora destructor TaxID=86335 RepID=A0AAV0UK00_9STRA|nr:unnamed protein product [Peronospora destructor]
MTPVCLIGDGADGLHVTEEGIRLLESLNEPVATICLAGQYRTGKSFFLNQLASHCDNLPWTGNNGNLVTNDITSSNDNGFCVGPTTESCTRGIWLWAPQPPVRNPAGQLVLFLDTEGMASTDNDESYDAKIFSLGLLLSSLFVYNTMGVIDEGAIDRLYLVSELTKLVCVSTHPYNVSAVTSTVDSGGASSEEAVLSGDKLKESRALAQHFPPFVWLLRDFLLDMQIGDSALTANQYLEKALDARVVNATASESTRLRQEERNRTRASIRVLFGRRECMTLVRPVTNERDLRRAADLSDAELRSEFVEQMSAVRRRLLSSAVAKELLGKVLHGPQVAQLARCYTGTMNSGAVPDIKTAWEYVSDATCQAALAASIDLYDTLMEAVTGKKPSKKANDDRKTEDTDKVEGGTGSDDAEGRTKILSQTEFEATYKNAQEEALSLFKARSIEGTPRTVCFQNLKQHMQVQRTALIAQLQRRSSKFCAKVLAKLRAKFLTRPLAAGTWDAAANKEEAFQATMSVLEKVYKQRARGPAKKKVFYQFLRVDFLEFFEALFQRMTNNQAQETAKWNYSREKLELQHANDNMEWKRRLHEKTMEVQQLLETKKYLKDKIASQTVRISEMQYLSQQQIASIAELDIKRKNLSEEIEQLHAAVTGLTKDLEKTRLRLEHKEESLTKVESEARSTKQELTKLVESFRTTQVGEREDWIRRTADQAAEKVMLRKNLKQAEHEVQQQKREIELLDQEQRQLQQLYDTELDARVQLENEHEMLRGDNDEMKRQMKHIAVQHVNTKQAAERERVRLEARLQRFQMQLCRLERSREVEVVLRDCVSDVVRLADEERIITLQEERRILQEQLGDLHEKISTLPDFYVRQIFCAPEPVTSFFDALTFGAGDPRTR